MGGERAICADGECVDGWGAVGDGVCGGAADYGDGEDGAGKGGGWGGMCLVFFLSPSLSSRFFFLLNLKLSILFSDLGPGGGV